MLSTNFTFEKEDHRYFLDGKRLPSVTEIISSDKEVATDYSSIPEEILKRAAEIGRGVHSVVEKWIDTDSIPTHPDRSVEAYLVGFRKWARLGAFRPCFSEMKLYHPELWYAGTIDAGGIVKNKGAILEVKTTNNLNMPQVELQTAAYEMLIGFWIGKVDRIFGECDRVFANGIDRYCLHLDKSGNLPKLHRAKDPLSYGDFERLAHNYNRGLDKLATG